jgi:hypothetical protein
VISDPNPATVHPTVSNLYCLMWDCQT